MNILGLLIDIAKSFSPECVLTPLSQAKDQSPCSTEKQAFALPTEKQAFALLFVPIPLLTKEKEHISTSL